MLRLYLSIYDFVKMLDSDGLQHSYVMRSRAQPKVRSLAIFECQAARDESRACRGRCPNNVLETSTTIEHQHL